MATKKKATKSTAWMDDGDDAHFDGNPAYRKTPIKNRKRMTKKEATGSIPMIPGVGRKPKVHKKVSRKRVAGKK